MSTQLSTTSRGPGFALAPASMSEAITFASQVAECDLLPPHLKGNAGNCLRVVMQSAQWGMNFFGVADKTSVIQGKLMYEGQLTAAVVNHCGNLKSRLNYKFEGDGANRVLTVIGTIRGEDEPREITLTHKEACAINRNGQMQKNPDQQMCYIGARIWTRRHMPELMLGVYGDDEHMDDGDISGAINDKPERPTPPKKAKGGAAAAREMKPAEVVDSEPETEPEPESKPKPEPEPEPATEAEVLDMEPDEAKEPEPKKPAKAVPLTTIGDGKTVKGNFAIEEVRDGKDKAGNIVKVLTVKGPYEGIAYCKDSANEFAQEPGMVWLELQGVAKGDKTLALVTAIQDSQPEI